jgi:hypothetical protein
VIRKTNVRLYQGVSKAVNGKGALGAYRSRRPSMDLSSVTSSAYSMSIPTGMP